MTGTKSPNLTPVFSQDLTALSGLNHAYFTRPGGVSEGIYAGLNVGVGSNDDQARVKTNRKMACEFLGMQADNLITLYQIHSPDVLIVDRPIKGERPGADGLATRTPGLMLGVLTADCGPVLFADENAGVIGACHAGWKGATGGVLESTIEAMEKLGAKRHAITAVLGPTISQENYEVGPEFIDRLVAMDTANTAWLSPSRNADHGMFDLPGYVVNRLQKASVTATWTGQCTYEDEENFFSYRRTTHRREPDYGRQLSAICLKTG